MNKAKLFLVAAAPVALVIPLEVQAAESEIPVITGENLVNKMVEVDLSKLPAGVTLSNPQWYYVEDEGGTVTYKAIDNATKQKLEVPIEAAGKKITVKVVDDKGIEYFATPIEIKAIALKIKPEFNIEGASQTSSDSVSKKYYATPGDKLNVNNLTIEDANGATIKDSQVTYQFQWYYRIVKDGNTPSYVYMKIEGATNSSFIVPEDALKKSDPINNIIVKISAVVNGQQTSEETSSEVQVSNKLSTTLVNDIETLYKVDGNTKKVSFNKTRQEILDLESLYLSLSTAAKAQVMNYALLQQALADIRVVENFEKTLPEDIKNATIAQKQAAIQALNQLTVLQVSLLKPDIISDILSVSGTDKNSQLLIEIVVDEIMGKMLKNAAYGSNELTFVHVYDVDAMEENLPDTEGLSPVEIAKKYVNDFLETKMKEFTEQNRAEYTTSVKGHTLYKEALKDIKAVESFEKKMGSIDSSLINIDTDNKVTFTTKDEKIAKKASSAAKTAKTAFDKLTFKQQSLVDPAQVNLIENVLKAKMVREEAESTPSEKVKKIRETIEKWKSLENAPANDTEFTELEKDIEEALSAYKTLTSIEKKGITDYSVLTNRQTDIKAIKKMDSLMDKIDGAIKSVDKEGKVVVSKVSSAYKGAYNAYAKLTTYQKSVADSMYSVTAKFEEAKNLIEENQKPEELDIEKATTLVRQIDSINPTSDYDSFKTEVNNADVAYRGIKDSKVKKYVTNYVKLAAYMKDVKAVDSFRVKVLKATTITDVKKINSTIASLEKSYAKLTAIQQGFVSDEMDKLKVAATDLEETVTTEIEDIVKEIYELKSIPENYYVKSIDDIKDLEVRYKKLSSTEKKLVTNYSVLKTALADVKKAETFMGNVAKNYGNNPSKVLMEFKKLNNAQISLLDDKSNEQLQTIIDGIGGENDAVKALVNAIDALEVDGKYVSTGLAGDIQTHLTTYNDLSAENKKLVKNISKLAQAEKDLQKVKEVKALYDIYINEAAKEPADEATKEVALKVWQQAYNKLSNKLESLYILLYNQ